MSQRLSQTVSLPSAADSDVSVDWSVSRSFCHRSRHWSWRDLIMAVRLWLVFPVSCYAQKYDHVTHLLWDLHWLRACEFRLAVLVFRCHNNMAPPYLLRDVQWTDLRSGIASTTTVRLSTALDRIQIS